MMLLRKRSKTAKEKKWGNCEEEEAEQEKKRNGETVQAVFQKRNKSIK